MTISTHNKVFILIILVVMTAMGFRLSVLNDHSVFATAIQQGNLPVYIVQQGDTLGDLELRFGVSAEDIQAANNIDNPNALFIGQRLIIPGLEGITGILTSEIVPFGTSLHDLARQYRITSQDLSALNRVTSPSETIAGARFTIPIDEQIDSLFPTQKFSLGETILEASIKTDDSPWSLLHQNQVYSSFNIVPGEFLYSTDENTSAPTMLAGVSDIWINQLPLVQGETFQMGIKTESAIPVNGTLNSEDLVFHSEDDEIFFSFHGIHAMEETGPVLLELSVETAEGNLHEFEQLILLVSGNYGDESIRVDDEYLDQTTIENEDNYLRPFINTISPDKLWEGRFIYPVDEPCPTSPFGLRRDYNNGKLFFYHTGLDFRVCAPNLNIYATAPGIVVLAEELIIRGNYVLIDHGWGIYSSYVHLSEINVSVGDRVEPGDIIGLIGSTGRSTGPHLHFEIIIAGIPVNPMTWLEREFPQSVR